MQILTQVAGRPAAQNGFESMPGNVQSALQAISSRNRSHPATEGTLGLRIRHSWLEGGLGGATTRGPAAGASQSWTSRMAGLLLRAPLPHLLDSCQALGAASGRCRAGSGRSRRFLGVLLLQQGLQPLAQLLGVFDRDALLTSLSCSIVQLLRNIQRPGQDQQNPTCAVVGASDRLSASLLICFSESANQHITHLERALSVSDLEVQSLNSEQDRQALPLPQVC